MDRSWRWATLALAIVLVGTGFWGYNQFQRRQNAEILLGTRYQQQFFDAMDQIQNVEVLLGKGLVAAAPDQAGQLFSETWRSAQQAQSDLTQLPLSQGTLMRTSKFLTQVGDFAFMLAKNLTDGKHMTGEDEDRVRMLKDKTGLLSRQLHQVNAVAQKGDMPWIDFQRVANTRLREGSKNVVQDGFNDIEDSLDVPTLIYDGPFSDHILDRAPKGLTGDTVDLNTAEDKALTFAAVPNRGAYVAEKVTEVKNNKMPAYRIGVRKTGEKNAQILTDVTKKGGHVVWMTDARDVRTQKLTVQEAARAADRFLTARGFANMVPTYASVTQNRAVFPMVPMVDGVLIYPDLVKVTVALDNGQIIGYEGLNYLMSHHDRNLSSPEVTAAEALQSVDQRLQVEDPQSSVRLALIPLETLDEVLTWEITGTFDGEPYLVYVNARTGEQERILRILRTNEGTLTQ